MPHRATKIELDAIRESQSGISLAIPLSSIWTELHFAKYCTELQYLSSEYLVESISSLLCSSVPREWIRIVLRAHWKRIEQPDNLRGFYSSLRRIKFIGPKSRVGRPKSPITLYQACPSGRAVISWSASKIVAEKFAEYYQSNGIRVDLLEMLAEPHMLYAVLPGKNGLDYVVNPQFMQCKVIAIYHP